MFTRGKINHDPRQSFCLSEVLLPRKDRELQNFRAKSRDFSKVLVDFCLLLHGNTRVSGKLLNIVFLQKKIISEIHQSLDSFGHFSLEHIPEKMNI